MIEADLISGLTQNPDALSEVLQIITPDDFVDIRCRKIFDLMVKSVKFDYRIISSRISQSGDKDLLEYYYKIMDIAFGSNVMQYAKEVRIASKKRKQLEIAKELIGSVKTDMSPEEIIEFIGGKLMALYDSQDYNYVHVRQVMIDYFASLSKIIDGEHGISGLSTGIKSLDAITDGLKPSELIIIGARPSQGKTSLMTTLAYNMAVGLKKTVIIFSIESSNKTIIEKMVSQVSMIDSYKLRRGDLNKDLFGTVTFHIDQISISNMILNDCAMNIHRMRAQIKKAIRDGYHIDCVFVDYLQIIDVERGHDSMAVKVGRVTQGLKEIAKELNCPVVALAQLNRGDETGEPSLHSLKASGDIEQIADQVWLLHRYDFYDKNCKEEYRDKIQIDIAKNREGQTMPLLLNWEGRCTRIYE